MNKEIERLVERYRTLGIDRQLDYDKFYLYSLITHSTAIEGSTITELENQIMFDNGIALKGKSLIEQNMNLDLKAAYERMLAFARSKSAVSVDRLIELSALTMRNTGSVYHTALGDFSSAAGELRLLNVTAGVGGRSYMAYNKVPTKLKELCETINAQRNRAGSMSLSEQYAMSFDAHYHLVTIHPWADGNGRMARLMMHWIQFELGLIPSRILSTDKEDYIKALVATRETEDLQLFRNFMYEVMEKQLTHEIAAYEKLIADDEPTTASALSTSDLILNLLRANSAHTARTLAEAVGISVKGVEKQLAKLKAEGRIVRIGPAKGGRWEVCW
jgi:Fic family protein